jgi:hypothetical protein
MHPLHLLVAALVMPVAGFIFPKEAMDANIPDQVLALVQALKTRLEQGFQAGFSSLPPQDQSHITRRT